MEGIVLRNICKIYPSADKKRTEGVKAVDNFNMEIEGNEFIVFVGPSGCGKSTTLRMIAGLEKITSGELYIDGQYMNDTEPKDRDIAMVFQNYALYPHMTAYKNIAFGLTLRKTAIPVYEKTEATVRKLESIDQLETQINKTHGTILSTEKAMDPLERKLANQKLYLESIQEEIDVLSARKAKTNKVQKQLIKLDQMRCSVLKTCEELDKQLSAREEKIAACKEKIRENKEKIAQLRSELAAYQKKEIDKKAIANCRKNISYYTKLAAKDELRRKRDMEALSEKQKELAVIEGRMKAAGAAEGADQKQQMQYSLELKKEAILDEISFLREELGILDTRKETIERERKANEEKATYYASEPQPVFQYRRYTREEIDSKIKMAAEILDIKKLLNRKPREMSGGQRQRIALGRAIVREPKVFLLDEPLSNLDAKLRASMRVEISKLHEKLKTTFIYVTHDQVEAMTMGTRIVVMKDGIVQQIDTPTNLFDYPDNVFVAGFIGTPQMNFFDVSIAVQDGQLKVTFADRTVLYFETAAMRKLDEKYCDGKEHSCVLGIRGEDIAVSESGLPAKVSVVEVLGNETHIHVSSDAVAADKEIVVNLRERVNYQAEDGLFLMFDGSKLHLFDGENQNSILERPQ